MKKIALLLLLALAISCTRIEPANPRPIPNIDVGVPQPLPDKPRYEPPPTSPTSTQTTVKHEIEATRTDFLPSEITVQKGNYVSLRVTAIDIPQRFTMPSFGIDEPLPVGEDVNIEFLADREGTFLFYSEGNKGLEGKLIVK